ALASGFGRGLVFLHGGGLLGWWVRNGGDAVQVLVGKGWRGGDRRMGDERIGHNQRRTAAPGVSRPAATHGTPYAFFAPSNVERKRPVARRQLHQIALAAGADCRTHLRSHRRRRISAG